MIKAFLKIRKFIREHRKNGITEFKILTTGDKIILISEPRPNEPDYGGEQLRLHVPNLGWAENLIDH